MYNLNTKQGKEERIKKLYELNSKLTHLKPTDELTLDDIKAISTYLIDIAHDIKGQLFIEEVKDHK